MQFISVYWQSKKIKAEGFLTQREAINFLGWKYEDNDLIPLGIYDSVLCEAIPYQHQTEPVICTDLALIEQSAQAFISESSKRTLSNGKQSTSSYFLTGANIARLIRWLRPA